MILNDIGILTVVHNMLIVLGVTDVNLQNLICALLIVLLCTIAGGIIGVISKSNKYAVLNAVGGASIGFMGITWINPQYTYFIVILVVILIAIIVYYGRKSVSGGV